MVEQIQCMLVERAQLMRHATATMSEGANLSMALFMTSRRHENPARAQLGACDGIIAQRLYKSNFSCALLSRAGPGSMQS